VLVPFCEDKDIIPPKVRWDAEWLYDQNSHGEQAGWVGLLQQLHESYNALEELFYQRPMPSVDHKGNTFPSAPLAVPHVVVLSRSWDFVPPGLVRPLAQCKVSELALLAYRLGLQWKQFQPAEGIFRAEGNSQVLTSTVVPGTGTIVQYGRASRKVMEENFFRRSLRPKSPYRFAQGLAFGALMSSCPFIHYGNPVLNVGSFEAICKSVEALLVGAKSIPVLRPLRYSESSRYFGEDSRSAKMFLLMDVIPFLSPVLGLSKSCICELPSPNAFPRGITWSFVGFYGFLRLLRDMSSRRGELSSQQAELILSRCEQLGRLQVPWGEDEAIWPWSYHNTDKLLIIWEFMQEAEAFLADSLVIRKNGYLRLVSAHIYNMVSNEMPDYWATGMEAVVDSLFDDSVGVVAQLKTWSTAFAGQEYLIEDAWITMMFRAFCWSVFHMWNPADPLPTEYVDSELPVYIE